jgi:hypothetical protein
LGSLSLLGLVILDGVHIIESGENERKTKKQVSFYAKASDVKSSFYTNQPIFVLLYKEACFNTNGLDKSLPRVVVSLLQEYEYMFPNDVPSGLPPVRGNRASN